MKYKVLAFAFLICLNSSNSLAAPFKPNFLKISQQLQSILGAQAEALNSVDSQQVPSADGKKPWRLAGMVAGLELKASGIFSVAKIEGTENIQVQWYKEQPQYPKVYEVQVSKGSAITVKGSGGGLTVNDIAAQAEPAVESALYSGKINYQAGPHFRNNVKRAAQNFLNISRALAKVPSLPGWKADAFILEVQFDASGNISGSTTVGGGVGLRFDWERDADLLKKLREEKNFVNTPFDLKLQSFVSSLGKDLNYATSKAHLPGTDLTLEEVKVSLGVSAEGEVGVAQGSAGITGTLAFHRDETQSVNINDVIYTEAEGPVTLFQALDGQDTEKLKGLHLLKGILPRFNFIKIKRDPFRTGLDHAIKFSQSIARTAVNSSKGKWKVVEVSSEFDLGVSGELGLATVKGTKGIEFIFDTARWHTL